MPSIVTGIIGGIQGSHAAHDAANAQAGGYQKATDIVNTAVGNANPIIGNAASTAGAGLTGAANTAGANLTGAANTAGANLTGTANNAVNALSPYASLGSTAAGTLSQLTAPGANVQQLMGTLDPGYEFRLQQGLQGVQQSAAAGGLLQSGAAARGLNNYAQGQASQEYQNTFNRLQSLANMGTQVGEFSGQLQTGAAGQAGQWGMNAAGQAGQWGVGAAGQAGQWGVNAGDMQAANLVNAGVYGGNAAVGAGNAIAQGDIGAANAWNGMLGGIGSFGNSMMLAGLPAGGGGGWSFGNIGKNVWG